MMSETIYGYFESAGDASPAYDPGIGVPCPICLRSLARGGKIKTISLMPEDGTRSYFFRAHIPCWDGASTDEKERIEHALIDSENRPTREG